MGAGYANNLTKAYEIVTKHYEWDMDSVSVQFRGERKRLFGSREREGKMKIPFPFSGKGTENLRFVFTGNGNSRSPLIQLRCKVFM